MKKKDKTIILGHRGVPNKARENTLESFRLALDAGLDGVELDTYATSDGVVVICHDLWTSGLDLRQSTWAQINRLAPWIPRLEQVFELFDEYPSALLNIELKSIPPQSNGAEKIISDRLKEWSGRERVWISSFDLVALIRFRNEKVGVPLAFLVHLEEMFDLGLSVGIDGIHPLYTLVNEQRMEAARAGNYTIHTWTVNEVADALRMMELGVDGIIGDIPETLLVARAQSGL